jgi:hypothetical protein|tara:strand:- start:208 stop:438 length:231 start_codon:yes stop_codon:yes gene_type:complete
MTRARPGARAGTSRPNRGCARNASSTRVAVSRHALALARVSTPPQTKTIVITIAIARARRMTTRARADRASCRVAI